jgi:hypothetical protein
MNADLHWSKPFLSLKQQQQQQVGSIISSS